MLTIVNTASSSRAVVPDSAATTEFSESTVTTVISASARSVVKMIAVHGERRPGSTLPSERSS